jgi:hypothetical protein
MVCSYVMANFGGAPDAFVLAPSAGSEPQPGSSLTYEAIKRRATGCEACGRLPAVAVLAHSSRSELTGLNGHCQRPLSPA